MDASCTVPSGENTIQQEPGVAATARVEKTLPCPSRASCLNRGRILLHTLGDTLQFGIVLLVARLSQSLSACAWALFQHFHEVLTEPIYEGELIAGLTQLLDLPLLLG